MNVLERIKNGELIARVWPFKQDFTTEQSNDLSKYLIKLAENGQRMQWVSVEDRLPNFNGKVIACINGKEVMGCSFNNDAKQFFHIQNLKNVTHWMPLPPQP